MFCIVETVLSLELCKCIFGFCAENVRSGESTDCLSVYHIVSDFVLSEVDLEPAVNKVFLKRANTGILNVNSQNKSDRNK